MTRMHAAATRPRNAAATREAILASAHRAFALSGYDGAGVREIASGAGVTAMLVNRYFGSKEQLFSEVLAQAMKSASVLTSDFVTSPTPGRDIAAALVQHSNAGEPPLDGMRIILSSASNPRAAEITREQMEKHHQALVASVIQGDDAARRAALVLSVVAGFQFMRQMIGLKALAEADPAQLGTILGDLLQRLINGTEAN